VNDHRIPFVIPQYVILNWSIVEIYLNDILIAYE
jgi:hypothetical protein